jgi:hypothetical protein
VLSERRGPLEEPSPSKGLSRTCWRRRARGLASFFSVHKLLANGGICSSKSALLYFCHPKRIVSPRNAWRNA